MTQKLLKIGSSRGVSLPPKELEEFGFETNGDVEVISDKKIGGFVVLPKKATLSKEFVSWTNDFIEEYRTTLEALAKR